MATSLPSAAMKLEAGLARVLDAPRDLGRVELIVARPAEDERRLLARARLEPGAGLIGDGWSTRPSSASADGGPNPDAEVTVMSARAAALVATEEEGSSWARAGDQLFVEFDISHENVPSGTRLAVGEAVLEVSALPHLGCGKFARRFGVEALKLVNSERGKALRLRGLNARVLAAGTVRCGDAVRKLEPPH